MSNLTEATGVNGELITRENAVLAWHFLPANGRIPAFPDKPDTKHTGVLVRPRQVLVVRGRIALCDRGLHASVDPLDALSFNRGLTVQRVALHGRVLRGTDKLCASRRTCLWIADATRTVHEWAIWCGTRALERERAAGREPDPRSWAALRVAAEFVAGRASAADLSSARSAAWTARSEAWTRYDAAAYSASAGASASAAASASASASASAADAAYAYADAAAYAYAYADADADAAADAGASRSAAAAAADADDAAYAAYAAADAAADAYADAYAADAAAAAYAAAHRAAWKQARTEERAAQSAELERRLLLLAPGAAT